MASIIKADTLQSTTANVFILNSSGTEYARFDSTGVFQLTNPTTFPAGTAAAPSITATGDTNTGLYFPTADTIAFSEGGVESMRIDSSGRVGIGTTSPATLLHLKSTTSGAPELRIEGTGTNNGVITFLGAGHANTAVGIRYVSTADSTGHLAFYANGTSGTLTERMRILSTGNILCLAGGSNTATGTGIAFPATQSASSDANTLDDYEEGTWTPTVFLGATSNSIGTATGTYTKIGNVVFFACRAENVTKSGTGSLTMAGLPFTASSAGNQNRYAQFAVRWTGINSGGVIVALAGVGTTTIEFQNFTTTGGYSGAVGDSGISAAYSVYGVSGFYYTST